MELVELCPNCNGDEWALVEDDRVCVQCRAVMELTEVPDDFYCPCGCDGIADLCVYAATCPDCGNKFYGGRGYCDKNTQCDECKQKNLCLHCASEFTCPHANENRTVCASFGNGSTVGKLRAHR